MVDAAGWRTMPEAGRRGDDGRGERERLVRASTFPSRRWIAATMEGSLWSVVPTTSSMLVTFSLRAAKSSISKGSNTVHYDSECDLIRQRWRDL